MKGLSRNRWSCWWLALLTVLLAACVSRESIRISTSPPLPHSHLAAMQSISPEEQKGIIYFGDSKRYEKRGVTVVLLKGDPYEIGYSRGVLLKNEIRDWVRDNLYMIKTQSWGTFLGETWMISRAREVEQFIPQEYREELNGLSAGSGVDYDLLLMLNVLDTIGRQFGCTSVTVKDSDGKLLRSRNLDYKDLPLLRPWMLIMYQPTHGYAFASVSSPGSIGVLTAMNEKGLTFGSHDISASSKAWRGIPAGILNRNIIQNAPSVKEVGEILNQSLRCLPRMFMVANSNNAGIYEFDSKQLGYKGMNGDHLILTNHTRVINIGSIYSNSLVRYHEAQSFLSHHGNNMDVKKLIDLNRCENISWAYDSRWHNLHSAVFRPHTLDFWIAIDPPPATRGRWAGFNLIKELHGVGAEPKAPIIPAMD
jgi:predicted choloylglycine hydrolase